MNLQIVLAEDRHFADAWMLLEEYFEVAQVVVRDDRAALSKYCIWLAYMDEIPAGCILLRSLQAQTGEIKRLYVRPAFRSMGLAVQLLAALESYASAMEMTDLYLDTNDDFREALRFYERSGYRRCERYNDNPQATIFLTKSL